MFTTTTFWSRKHNTSLEDEHSILQAYSYITFHISVAMSLWILFFYKLLNVLNLPFLQKEGLVILRETESDPLHSLVYEVLGVVTKSAHSWDKPFTGMYHPTYFSCFAFNFAGHTRYKVPGFFVLTAHMYDFHINPSGIWSWISSIRICWLSTFLYCQHCRDSITRCYCTVGLFKLKCLSFP